MQINGRNINNSIEPYVIAELSANHCGSIELAKKTIKSAKENGADAIKIQTYTANSMTLDCDKDDFLIKDGTWKGYKLYDLYREASNPYEWHKELFEFDKGCNLTIFSTTFDEITLNLGTVPFFKLPFIKAKCSDPSNKFSKTLILYF